MVPRDSAWFSWYDGKHLIPLQEQPLWHEDRLGLKELHSSGRLHFESVPGGHMQFSLGELIAILDRYMSFERQHDTVDSTLRLLEGNSALR